jgi:hypothetical protein
MSGWRYAPHALKQMDAREATYAEVEETLTNPYSIRETYRRRLNYYRAIDGYAIRVTIVARIRLIVTVWKEPLP